MRYRCPSVFASLTIYALMIRSSDKTQRELAENRARLLMLGLNQIAETWPASTWILRLFQTIFKNQQMERPWGIRDQQETASLLSANDRIAQEEILNRDGAATNEQHECTASYGHPSLQLTGGMFEEGNGQMHRDPSYLQTLQAPLSANEYFDAELLTWFPDDWLGFKFPDGF